MDTICCRTIPAIWAITCPTYYYVRIIFSNNFSSKLLRKNSRLIQIVANPQNWAYHWERWIFQTKFLALILMLLGITIISIYGVRRGTENSVIFFNPSLIIYDLGWLLLIYFLLLILWLLLFVQCSKIWEFSLSFCLYCIVFFCNFWD